jgi:hypothetical protein
VDPNSGRIYEDVPNEENARRRGLVKITKQEHGRLIRLPEPQRPAELLAIRASHPLAMLPGMTADDVRQIRNAMKRERRARRSLAGGKSR